MLNTNSQRFALASLTASLVVMGSFAACGGDSGGYSFDTAKPLNTLTDAEQVTLCEEYQANLSGATTEGIRRLACVLQVTNLGSIECNPDEFEQCLTEPVDLDQCEPFDAEDEEADCTATTAAYLACIDAYAAQYAQFSDLSCTSGGDTGELLAAEELPACDELLAACPDISID